MKTFRIILLVVFSFSLVSCDQKPKVVKEEPRREIISFSIKLKPVDNGYKPLTMYCDSVGSFIDYENITYVRYGSDDELINNRYDNINDTIQVVFNSNVDNLKYNDKLCLTYPYYEKNEGRDRRWYTLIVCDSVPERLIFSASNKEVKYDVVSYTISKRAPLWQDEYPDMLYYPETDEYLKTEDEENSGYVGGIDDISEIPVSIVREVPNGFSILHIAYGDLNGDHVDDAVLVLQDTADEASKIQILFGQNNNQYSSYTIFDAYVYFRECRESYIDINDGMLNITNAKWACGQHGSHYTHTCSFKYSAVDKKIYLIEEYLLHQNVEYNVDYEEDYIDEEIEDYTYYVGKISIEDYY